MTNNEGGEPRLLSFFHARTMGFKVGSSLDAIEAAYDRIVEVLARFIAARP